jgi:hypothetical protein
MMGDDIPSYLIEPPVYDTLLDGTDNPLNVSWINWFNSVVQAIGQCITHDAIVDINMNRFDVAILMPTQGTTLQRNQLANANNGSIWYNTDTEEFNFRQNGVWVKFTPIPA